MNRVHFSSKTDDHATPQDLFDKLNGEFGFKLDVCADERNAKCDEYFDKKADGLRGDWTAVDGWKYMNPPYGREIGKWVAKAAVSRRTVALLPSRTDTAWWHDHIWDAEKHCPRPGVEVRLLRGRLKFGSATNSAPFPSVVVVFR